MNMENSQTNASQIDLYLILPDLLLAARRLLWLGLLFVLLAGSFFGWRAYASYSPLYEASASFTVTVTNPLYSNIKSYNSATAEQMAKTFPHILTSGALSDLVKERLNTAAIPPVSASVLANTNIFTITVTSADPQMAYDVLNTVIQCYPEVAEFVVGPTHMNLLSESGVPTFPCNRRDIAPSVKKGVLLGAALWLAVVLLVTFTRPTVHNEDELKRLTNLRCLASIPYSGRKAKKSSWPLLSESGDRFGFSESVRLLRIRVEKEMHAQHHKVLLVSSAIPNEGKTTVAANLALSLAQKKKRTLLIDLDLRNSSANRVFGLDASCGITDVLSGKASAQDLLTSLPAEHLSAIFAGTPASHSTELLNRRELRELIQWAKESFDYVILDTPPCAMLADAAEAAGMADCALIIIRQNHSSRDQILEGVQLLADTGLPVIGCALNGVRRSIRTGSYGYGHGYGYGYGYGYGRQENPPSETADEES